MAATVFRSEERRYRDWKGQRTLAELVRALGVTDLDGDEDSSGSSSSSGSSVSNISSTNSSGAVRLAGCEVRAYTLTTPCPGAWGARAPPRVRGRRVR
jgi:hypothetical protein